MKQYYAERRASVSKRSVFYQFFEHERKLRELGAVIDARLATVSVPATIEALFDDASGIGYDLALQTRNLYDALACNDLLDISVASLDFNGWDSHNAQRDEFARNAAALFGGSGALAALYSNLPQDARSNTVFLVGGEFGRQLASNGGGGTDHGEGLVTILIGDAVQGGVYGTMFPEQEMARFNVDSAQIEGVNAIEHVFGRVGEWVMPGSRNQVFPNAASAPLEAAQSAGDVPRMNNKHIFSGAALLAMFIVGGNSWAADTSPAAGAQAAALASEADALEADIDKECHKVAREARPLCRSQHVQAVQRLRARVARLR